MSGWVTTFYSYKGGVGRTFLLANVGWLLARWGRRVLCLDWDLEAPGLHRYLAPHAPRLHGVLDLVEIAGGVPHPRKAPWREWVETVSGPWTDGGCLHLLAAGPGGDDYVQRVQALRWDQLSEAGLEAALERVREEWVAEYDHVLIDSRTGITDIGGICAAQLPDLLVLTFTATHQSLEGAIDVAGRAARARSHMPLSRGAFNVLPVPCRVHAGEEDRLEQEWTRRFESALGDLMAPWKERTLEVREYIAQLRVREQARWSFGEQMPARTEPLDDPLRVSHAFANVAALIDKRLDDSGAIVRDRHDLLSALAGSAGLAAPEPDTQSGFDVFVSYPFELKPLAASLVRALQSLGLSVFFDQLLPLGTNIKEGLYRARENARAFIVFLHASALVPGRGQWDELQHIERLESEAGVTIIPLFAGDEAFARAPASLTNRLGLFIEEEGTMEMVARKLARTLRRGR